MPALSEHPSTRAALVVEDDARLRQALADALEDDGFEVMTSTTLSRAQYVLFESRHPVDVVVLDLMLADGDATPLLEQLDRAPRAPAVVLLSANVALAIAHGSTYGVPYVTKPFDLGVVVASANAAQENRMRPHRVRRNISGTRPRVDVPESDETASG